jgi:hypothetical protein
MSSSFVFRKEDYASNMGKITQLNGIYLATLMGAILSMTNVFNIDNIQ